MAIWYAHYDKQNWYLLIKYIQWTEFRVLNECYRRTENNMYCSRHVYILDDKIIKSIAIKTYRLDIDIYLYNWNSAMWMKLTLRQCNYSYTANKRSPHTIRWIRCKYIQKRIFMFTPSALPYETYILATRSI